jgi:hypothetical protein
MKHKLVFFAIVIGLFFLFHFHEIMLLRPQSVHQWRQCDSASYALNYYQNNAPFFFPETMNLLGEGGRAMSEFPIIYYIAAQLYKVFGFHESILRLLNYGVFFLGLYAMFKLGFLLLQQQISAYPTPLFLIASPLLSYYALNFLPNVPALGLTFISWYFYFIFIKNRRLKDFLFCSIAAMFAALLKPVEIFNYLIILLLCVFEFFQLLGLSKTKFDKKSNIKLFFIAFATIGINCAWIAYAKWYAVKFGYIGNLLGVMPVWGLTIEEFYDYCNLIKTKWLYQMYYPYFYTFLMLCAGFIVWFYKRLNRHLFLVWILLLLSQIVFAALFFQAFYHHDYYWINTFVIVPFTLFCTISILEKSTFASAKYAGIAVFSLFLFMSLKHSRHIILARYYGNLQEKANPVLEEITPYLRSIGIEKSDFVISVPDMSPNISLYLMGQKGWTECYTRDYKNIKHFVAQGAKYLIVNKEITREKDWYPPFMTQQIGEYKGVKIYKLNQ